jgi:hypothetical protein
MPSSISESIGAGTDAVAQAETDAFTLRVGTPKHFRWLEGIVKAVLVMNLFDAVMTLWWVSSGLATEANPFLEQIVTEHGFLFVVSKISIVILGTTLLWRYRTRPLAVLGIFAAFLVYYEVFLIHLSFASLLIGELIDA